MLHKAAIASLKMRERLHVTWLGLFGYEIACARDSNQIVVLIGQRHQRRLLRRSEF
jgi:hypothetical protein